MRRFERRTVLAALAGMTALAGCGADGASPSAVPSESEQPTESPSPTPTGFPTPTESSTPTPEPIDATDLTFVGSVVRQPSEDGPGRVRASLTNHSDSTIRVLGGAPVPLSPGIEDGPDDALLLLPEKSDRANEYSWTQDGDPIGDGAADVGDATYGDCWHAPGNGYLRTDIGDIAELSTGESVDVDFYPLARAGADCPRGNYTVQDELSVDGTGQSVRTELTVDIDADGRLETSGSLTVGEA